MTDLPLTERSIGMQLQTRHSQQRCVAELSFSLILVTFQPMCGSEEEESFGILGDRVVKPYLHTDRELATLFSVYSYANLSENLRRARHVGDDRAMTANVLIIIRLPGQHTFFHLP